MNYWFAVVSGEYAGYEFFVQANNNGEALKIAKDVAAGEKLSYYGKVSDEEAEMAGLDTY